MWLILTPKGNLNNYSTTESKSICLGAFQCLEVKKQPQDVPSDKHCRCQYATSQAELLGEDKGARRWGHKGRQQETVAVPCEQPESCASPVLVK